MDANFKPVYDSILLPTTIFSNCFSKPIRINTHKSIRRHVKVIYHNENYANLCKKQPKHDIGQYVMFIYLFQPTYYEFQLMKGYYVILIMYTMISTGIAIYKYSWYGPNTYVSTCCFYYALVKNIHSKARTLVFTRTSLQNKYVLFCTNMFTVSSCQFKIIYQTLKLCDT